MVIVLDLIKDNYPHTCFNNSLHVFLVKVEKIPNFVCHEREYSRLAVSCRGKNPT